jgi:hypothetical protein
METPKASEWTQAVKCECDNIRGNIHDIRVYMLEHVPLGSHTVGSNAMLAVKTDGKGKISNCKVCFVTKGYSQVHGTDYHKIWAPTDKLSVVRLLLGLAAQYNWSIRQVDGRAAFAWK